MINPTGVPAKAPIDTADDAAEPGHRDELSMRLVEWALALVAIGAAVVLAIR